MKMKIEKRSDYVFGSGCVKIGGNLTGSLGFGFGSATGVALFDGFVALDWLAAGFGAVNDGIGGAATDDGETPILTNDHKK